MTWYMRIGTGRLCRATAALPPAVVRRKEKTARIAAACASFNRGRMRRTALFVVLVALLLPSQAAAAVTQLMPGVSYQRVLRWTPAGPVVMYVVTAPKPQGLYKLTPLLSNGTIIGRQTVSSIERDASPQMTTVGVNGDFLHWTGGWPSGLLMQGGVVEHQSALGRAAVGVDTSAMLHTEKVPWFGRWHGPDNVWYPLAQPGDWASVTDAVSAGPTLVRDGKPIFNAGEALTPVQLRGRDPRTAIGQRADGTIVMVAVDGRRPGWSIGITNWDLAQTLVRYGCLTGFALDSGGSTTVAFEGEVLNRPSDAAGERPVGEALVIAYTGVYVPPVAPTLSPNADGVADLEPLTYKLVRPSTVRAQPVGPDGSTRQLDSASKAPGRYKLSWDGAGAPEGRYHWNVTATDDQGQVSTADRAFTLDNTLGFLRVGAMARTVAFTLTRDATIRVTIETRSGGILRTVAKGRRAAGTATVRWNGRDGRRKKVRRGTYVVRVAATSELGLSQLSVRTATR